MVDKNEKRTMIQDRPTNGPSTPATTRVAELPAAQGGAAQRGYGPFTFMRRFAEDMDHLFEEFGVHHDMSMPRLLTRGREWLRREAGFVPADWTPQVDVKEKDGKFIVRADLPGVPKEGVKIEVRDGFLMLQGERRHEKTEEREGHFYSECSYGSFARSIPLPDGADVAKADATYRDGVLEVAIPVAKATEAIGHRIPIH